MENGHVRLEATPRVSGFALNNGKEGEKVDVLFRAFITSDKKEFYGYIDQISNLYLNKHFLMHHVSNFLIVVHKDDSTDVYIEPPVRLIALSKSKIVLGELVKLSDIADISQLSFDEEVKLDEEDCIIFCFKVGWKFGLFFDFSAKHSTPLNLEKIPFELADFYKTLQFEKTYAILENTPLFETLKKDGWFPFIELLPNDYTNLATLYEEDREQSDFLSQFDEARVNRISSKWFQAPIFKEKEKILGEGISAYVNGSYISCIKTLYSEIEGIIRLQYFKEKGKKPTTNDLMEYVKEKATNRFVSKNSLSFPPHFYSYLQDQIFAGFDLSVNDVPTSRHSVNHGVLEEKGYTPERALQAILTLDQIYYFIS